MGQGDTSGLVQLLTLIVLVLGFVAAIPAAIGSYRRGKSTVDHDTIESQRNRITELEKEGARIQEQLTQLKASQTTLGAKLDAANSENLRLRGLVMGETVPEALAVLAQNSVSAIAAEVKTVENHVLSAILALGNDIHELITEMKEEKK